MTRNPHLQVLMAAGVYDLATPFFDAIFTRDHLGLPQELRRQRPGSSSTRPAT